MSKKIQEESAAVQQHAAVPPALSEGAEAPAFSLPLESGGKVSLHDFKGQRLVIFFYPRANTPGCTQEAIEFSRLAPSFADANTAVLGVSADSLTALAKFRQKHALTVPLASDESHHMLEAYGAWGKKLMYGKLFNGVFRSTVLIDPGGRVSRIWRNVKVKGHAESVLAAAKD